jgi:amino acid adenylation domain-containing protein
MTLQQRTYAPETATIREAIDRMAELRAQAPFLISPETRRQITFSEFRYEVIRWASYLASAGLTKGDKVAFLLDNGLFTVELLFAAMYGGFVPVPLNVVAGTSQVAHALSHSDARIVFVSNEYRPLLSGIASHIEQSCQTVSAHPDAGPEWNLPDNTEILLPAVHGDDEGLLIYTSGSTAHSKGVLFTQRNLLAGIANTITVYQFTPQDRSLCVLPLYHLNALTATLLPMLLSGGSVVTPHRFSVTHVWQWVADYHCTWFAAVPTILTHLVNWTNPFDEENADRLRQVRFIRSSSAPLSPSLHHTFEEKFPLLLVEAMGMTEAGEVFLTPPARAKQKIGSPGLPCHETRIVGAHGDRLPCGETGEILIRGPRLMKGYYKNPEATAEVLSPDGWLRTGDLGYQDTDGYVFIIGRAKEIVIKGGENIAPREIDDTLMRHTAVLEAAAVGVPDAYLGEDLVAYVVLKPGGQSSEQELLSHCAQALGEFKTPSRIYFVEGLPKGPSGKVQRLKLRERETTSSTPHDRTIARQAHPNHPDQQQLGFVTPRTPGEEKLTEIWEHVLQRTSIGIHDNFFALGGHSLLAAAILTRVREACRVSLPLRALFEAPTIAALAAHIEAVRPTDDSLPLPPIPSRPLDGAMPLSYAQQRLWFLEQFNPHTATYNIPFAFRLRGPLDLMALQEAMSALVARHEIFRTTFSSHDGDPRQMIAKHVPFSVTRVDLSSWPEALRETEALRRATEEVQRPFDLAQGPLLRTLVVRLVADDHLLVITWHHIIVDGWSLGVFTRELRILYEAFSHGLMPVLPPLPLQYADFAVWQRQWVQGEAIARQVAYWKKQLAGAPALLQLPTDHPRPAQQTYRGAHYTFLLSSSLTAALQHLGRQEGTTLYITLLAAFQVLLSRYTGEEDLVVGSPIAGRVRPELEELIGFFINTLVMRTDVSHNPTFRALLCRVRDTALDAYAHQDIPFEQLVEELRLPRALGYAPLVQVLFALQNVPRFSLELPGITSERVAVRTDAAKFDLSLLVWEDGEGLRGELEYNTDLFEAPTITRLASHYQTLLESIVANPDRPIASLPLLTFGERHQLLVSWNDTAQAYGHTQCIHQLFERQVERIPNAIAVIHEDQHLTYRELNGRANQLAHYLRTHGVGPDALVALCMERSVEMVVGLLGILKAGAAYVPLDPSYPQERLAFMLADTQAPVLLTQQRLVDVLPQHTAQLFCLDRDWEVIGRESTENTPAHTTAEDLAYVIYTSGSTGRPKGVAVPHRGIVRLVCGADYVPFDATQVFLQLAPLAFDAATFELWGALLHGAPCVLFPGWIPSPAELGRVLRDHQVSTLWLTASLFNSIIDQAPEILVGVKQLVTGGEALSVAHVRRALPQLPATQLINGYGPTESTTFACTYALPKHIEATTASIPIGRPIANTEVYILDPHLHPVPIGVGGELYIGGEGLARGYLRRPELTAEKFIPDPFSPRPGARLYRTGDLARYLPDGSIEFLGRIDQQVKLRGYRIELGEIEIALRQHSAIQEAVVNVQKDSPGDKRLVAYVVLQEPGAPSHQALKGYLQQKLPEYMIPSAFVVVDRLPLLPNGKVDRQALPAPEQSRPELAEGFVAPRTPLEEILVTVWREVLGVERVGIHDNFFELGGHSLKATQVVARVRAIRHLEFPLRTMFEVPTVAGMAAYLNHAHDGTDAHAEVAGLLTGVENLSEEEAQKILSDLQSEGIP